MKNMKKLFTPLMLTLFLVLAAVPLIARRAKPPPQLRPNR